MGTRSAVSTIRGVIDSKIVNALDSNETGSAQLPFALNAALAFATGTTANKSDRCWSDKGRTLTSGNDVQIDIYDFAGENVGSGAGNDALGQTLTLAEITGILVENASTSVGDLVVGGDQGEINALDWNPLFNGVDGDAVTIKPGGFFLMMCPPDPAFPVADGTSHMLTCGASGGNVTYDIHILGRSA